MAFHFDPAKSARNVEQRGLASDLVEQFEWETAVIVVDDRRDYGEVRLRVFALLNDRLHAAVVTRRGPA
jgi:uncharacterized DUF497 family protein